MTVPFNIPEQKNAAEPPKVRPVTHLAEHLAQEYNGIGYACNPISMEVWILRFLIDNNYRLVEVDWLRSMR